MRDWAEMSWTMVRRRLVDAIAFLFAAAATLFGLFWLAWILWTTLVRGAAVWALSRLLPRGEFTALAARRIDGEGDAAVREEWQQALQESVGGGLA